MNILTEAMRNGLQNPPDGCSRPLPSLLLWDEQGLKPLEKFQIQPSNHLTDAEIDLPETPSRTIADRTEPGTLLSELGNGALRRTEILLRAVEAQGKDVDCCAFDL